VQLTPVPLARREAPRQRFEFSGPGLRPPQARVRWNELLGIKDTLAFKQVVSSVRRAAWAFPMTRAEHEGEAILEL